MEVDGLVVGEIGPGYCLLVAIAETDEEADVVAAVDKISGLRVFGDNEGKMNLALADVSGEVLVVSQFTLLGEARKGRRPSFVAAAHPRAARPLLASLADQLRARGLRVAEGEFGAKMVVRIVNDGPVTLILEVTGGRVV